MLLLDMLDVFISVTVSIVCNLYTATMDFFFGGGGVMEIDDLLCAL